VLLPSRWLLRISISSQSVHPRHARAMCVLRIDGRWFATTMALGARDRANMPVRTKNFFLAKTPDSESTTTPLTTLRHSRALWSRQQCIERESKKVLQYRRFLQSRRMPMPMVRAFLASWRVRIVASSHDARDKFARCCVNSSLRGTLFFLVALLYCKWCASRFPRCTQQLRAISLHQEGNMAKKAKKKAKSAVKKTAKKTRKVSKKKK
jgi:hypothetical protein